MSAQERLSPERTGIYPPDTMEAIEEPKQLDDADRKMSMVRKWLLGWKWIPRKLGW